MVCRCCFCCSNCSAAWLVALLQLASSGGALFIYLSSSEARRFGVSLLRQVFDGASEALDNSTLTERLELPPTSEHVSDWALDAWPVAFSTAHLFAGLCLTVALCNSNRCLVLLWLVWGGLNLLGSALVGFFFLCGEAANDSERISVIKSGLQEFLINELPFEGDRDDVLAADIGAAMRYVTLTTASIAVVVVVLAQIWSVSVVAGAGREMALRARIDDDYSEKGVFIS